MIQRSRRVLQQLGPGLITGAADDDPSGIATYSQAGAQFGYQLGWTLILTYPLMVAIQLVSCAPQKLDLCWPDRITRVLLCCGIMRL